MIRLTRNTPGQGRHEITIGRVSVSNGTTVNITPTGIQIISPKKKKQKKGKKGGG